MQETRKNGGIRKRCGCPKPRWAKCAHPWHFNFSWKGKHYRLSLDREVGRSLEGKTEALAEAEKLRTTIRNGTFQSSQIAVADAVVDARPTLGTVADIYKEKHIAVVPESGAPRRNGGKALMELHMKNLRRCRVPDGKGGTIALEEKPLADLSLLDLEAIRDGWALKKNAVKGGRIGVARALKRLRHFCNWAVERDYLSHTPFKKGNGVVAFHFAKEQPRTRRLEGDEGERLHGAADSLLRDLTLAALETGCRKGELLTFQWRDVKWDQKALLVRPEVSKTGEARDVPITKRLKAVLEKRKQADDDTQYPPDAFVFGNEVGEEIAPSNLRRRWITCCERANVTGLTFHDLRRELASRLRESGAPDHAVAAWLGHSNISTTSRYLKTSRAGLQTYVAAFERHRDEICTNIAQHNDSTDAGGPFGPS